MIPTKVFEIVEAEANQNIGLVRGLAYEDVQVGDSLLIEMNDGKYLEFKITGILTYRHELSFLSGGTTGQLTLEGTNPQALQSASHLLRLE